MFVDGNAINVAIFTPGSIDGFWEDEFGAVMIAVSGGRMIRLVSGKYVIVRGGWETDYDAAPPVIGLGAVSVGQGELFAVGGWFSRFAMPVSAMVASKISLSAWNWCGRGGEPARFFLEAGASVTEKGGGWPRFGG